MDVTSILLSDLDNSAFGLPVVDQDIYRLPERPANQDATSLSAELANKLADGSYQLKLAKHIRDHNTGQGHLSRPMYDKVAAREREASNVLSKLSPNASLQYNSYLTGSFAYNMRARFVSSVRDSALAVAKINRFSSAA